MSIKMKLVSLVSAFVLVLGLVITGVLAASSQTITMNGSVNFNVTDKSLWVKEVRMQEAGEDPVVISNFTPGYINGDFNFNVGDHNNSRGSFALYFDIINTTVIPQHVSVDYSGLSISGLEVAVTSDIAGNSEEITIITSDTPITTTLELAISNPNLATIDLSQIVINIESYTIGTLTYSYDSESLTAEVASCSHDAEIAIIPNTVEYNDQIYTVTSIRGEHPSTPSPAFYNCARLITVIIPSSVTSVETQAFYRCSSLTSINVSPDNITYSSEDGVLFNKDKTTLIRYPAGKSQTTYTMPDSVKNIQGDAAYFNGAFSYSLLTSIVIPSSVTSIGASVFASSNIITITIYATTPPTLSYYFSIEQTIPSTVTNIYVPAESVSTYQSADIWSNFASKISAIS